MDLRGPAKDPSRGRTVVDGLALALLVVAIFTAERFDRARETVDVLDRGVATLDDATAAEYAEGAAPDWLPVAWAVVAALGVVAALYVTLRFLRIAEELMASRPVGDWRRQALAPVAYAAVVTWAVWLVLGVVDVSAGITDGVGAVLHGAAIGCAVAAVGVGGAVLGDATEAWERGSVVRLQLLFLAVLFVVVFNAPFTADQMTDVLRAWGDGPASRAIAGIAAALLLGAVVRASAARLLVPNEGAAQRRAPAAVRAIEDAATAQAQKLVPSDGTRRRQLVIGSAVALGIVLLLLGLEASAFLALAAAGVVLVTCRPEQIAVARRVEEKSDPEAERLSLRRLAGTLGTVPLAILVVGLVNAAVDSLLLPSPASATDAALLAWSALTVVVLGLVAARAHAADGTPWTDLDDQVPGWWAGVAGLLFGLSMLLSALAASILLLLLAAALAFKAIARGAPELWAAWGVSLGVALAVYAEPVASSREFGAWGLALVGATLILAVLHMAGSVSVRRTLRFRLFGRRWAPPMVIILVLWVVVAWRTAPEDAHQVPTVATQERPATLDAVVREWVEAQPPPAEGEYVPMLLVGASGGGSKAAYWTDLVLDCVFGDGVPEERTDDECGAAPAASGRFGRLLLTSSVSGGSIGVHHLVNHRDVVGRETPWINRTAGREVLSPVIGWGMFHDLPAFMLGLETDPRRCEDRTACVIHADRAAVQEGALGVFGDGRKTEIDKGLLAQETLPLTVFNTTVDHHPEQALFGIPDLDRRAWLASTDLAEACRQDPVDGHDALAGADLPLVTASLLSARFPGLEPKGVLGAGGGAPCAPLTLRDGGIVENTGLLTIGELLPRILEIVREWKGEAPEREAYDVRPIVLSIDDDVLGVEGDTEYDGGNASRRSTAIRNRLRTCRIPGVTFRRISPVPHVGAQAATGWEISETSRREDLGASLRTRGLRGAVQEIRDMLDGRQRPFGCVAARPR